MMNICSTKLNGRLHSSNAKTIEIITEHELWHFISCSTFHFCCITDQKFRMKDLEDVYCIAVDLAREWRCDSFVYKSRICVWSTITMSKGELKLNKKQSEGFAQMYKMRLLETACINNGLTQLQPKWNLIMKMNTHH